MKRTILLSVLALAACLTLTSPVFAEGIAEEAALSAVGLEAAPVVDASLELPVFETAEGPVCAAPADVELIFKETAVGGCDRCCAYCNCCVSTGSTYCCTACSSCS